MSTPVSVIVPYRAQQTRQALWEWLERRWRSAMECVDGAPGNFWPCNASLLEVIVADSGDYPFSPGASRNKGFIESSGDIVIFADADTCTNDLGPAIELASAGRWVIAYDRDAYYALTDSATRMLLAREPDTELPSPSEVLWSARVTSFSGVLVMPRAAFQTVGGYDLRFRGWGYEDNALVFALDTLWSPHVRAPGWAFHLFHPHIEAERFQQPFIWRNRELADEYHSRCGNPALMRSLIDTR